VLSFFILEHFLEQNFLPEEMKVDQVTSYDRPIFRSRKHPLDRETSWKGLYLNS